MRNPINEYFQSNESFSFAESGKNNLQMKSIHEYDAEANGSTSNGDINEPQLTGFEPSKTDLTDGEKIGKTESNNNISENGKVKNGDAGVINETFKDDDEDSSHTLNVDKDESNLSNDEEENSNTSDDGKDKSNPPNGESDNKPESPKTNHESDEKNEEGSAKKNEISESQTESESKPDSPIEENESFEVI